MSRLGDLKHADHARLWSFEGMLLPLDGFFSTFGGSIHGLISFDHLKIGEPIFDTLLPSCVIGHSHPVEEFFSREWLVTILDASGHRTTSRLRLPRERCGYSFPPT